MKMAELPDPSEEELQSLYRDLAAAGMPALLSLVPGFSDDYMPLSEKGVLPKPLTDLYNAKYSFALRLLPVSTSIFLRFAA